MLRAIGFSIGVISMVLIKKTYLLLLFCTFLIAGASVTPSSSVDTDCNTVDLAIRKALLAEDWKTVADLCGGDERFEASPVLRAIKGHACLTLNRNDESLSLFLSLRNEKDREVWRKWALDFATKHPSNPVALYLNGDALARSADWHGAIKSYSSAMEVKNGFALALNARGVAWASLKDYNRARDDLDAAIVASPKFADAHASLGTLKILKGAFDTAPGDFDQAMSISSAFALAYNGRACARIGYSRDAESVRGALKDYSDAAQCRVVKPLAVTNIVAISRALESGADDSIKTSEGMTLSANQFRFMDVGSQDHLMSGMSKDNLSTITNQAFDNHLHSKSWGESFQYFSGIGDALGLNFSGLAEQSFRHAEEHMGVFNRGNEWLGKNYGTPLLYDPAGGAQIRELQVGYGNAETWPVRTWFGLAQQADVPNAEAATGE